MRRALLAAAALTLLPSTLATSNQAPPAPQAPVQSMTIEARTTTRQDRPLRVLAIELGDTADLEAFRKGVTHHHPEARITTLYKGRFAFPATKDTATASNNARKAGRSIESLLHDADVLYLSGHHNHKYLGTALFSLEGANTSPRSYDAAIDVANGQEHEELRAVIVATCYGANIYAQETDALLKRFPRAAILGYGMRSPPGPQTAKLIERFLEAPLDDEPATLAKRWAEAGKATYGTTRDVRGLWREHDTIYQAANVFSIIHERELR